MIKWMIGLKICAFGLGAVFLCLAVLIAFIYAFGIILKSMEKTVLKSELIMSELILNTGIVNLSLGNFIMWLIAFLFIYLAIQKNYEPLLLVPIGFGILAVNLPLTFLMKEGSGLLWKFYHYGLEWEVIPPLIFLGLGALTDFGPMISNPKHSYLALVRNLGSMRPFFGALLIGFDIPEACSIGIIGGADGPTTIFTTVHLAPHLLGATAVAAYSYMSLVPIIQPPIMRLLTSKEERKIRMKQLRPVSKKEKIIFPLITVVVICLIVPASAPLMVMFMLGNLLKNAVLLKGFQIQQQMNL